MSQPTSTSSRNLCGDEADLYVRHQRQLERTVHAMVVASDATVEDACAFAWLQLMRTGPERGPTLFAWLKTVAVREAIRLDRVQRRQITTDGTVPDPEDPNSLDQAVAARDALRALAALPARPRNLLRLQVAGLSRDEISATTGDSSRTVERQLYRGRRAVRDRGL